MARLSHARGSSLPIPRLRRRGPQRLAHRGRLDIFFADEPPAAARERAGGGAAGAGQGAEEVEVGAGAGAALEEDAAAAGTGDEDARAGDVVVP